MLTRKQHELLVYIDRHLRETGFSPSFDEMKEALGLRSKSGIHRLISALEERSFLQRRHHRARALEVLRLPDQLAPAPKPARPPALRAVPGSATVPGAPVGAPPPAAAATPGPNQAAASGAFSPTVIQGDFTRNLPGVAPANEVGSVELPLYGRIAAGVPIEAMRDQTSRVAVPIEMLGRGEHYALEVAGDSMVEAGILDGDTVLIQRGDQAENGQIIVALVDEEEVTLKRLRRRGNSIALEPANPRHEIRIFPAERVRVQGTLIGLLRRY